MHSRATSPTNRVQTLPLLLDTNQYRSFWSLLCYLIAGMACELEAEQIVFGLARRRLRRFAVTLLA